MHAKPPRLLLVLAACLAVASTPAAPSGDEAPPYPPSPVIRGITWAPAESILRRARGGAVAAMVCEGRRLRPDIPVIIITGYSSEASAIEAVNLGVSGYLTKPFRVPRVLAAAAKALGE